MFSRAFAAVNSPRVQSVCGHSAQLRSAHRAAHNVHNTNLFSIIMNTNITRIEQYTNEIMFRQLSGTISRLNGRQEVNLQLFCYQFQSKGHFSSRYDKHFMKQASQKEFFNFPGIKM